MLHTKSQVSTIIFDENIAGNLIVEKKIEIWNAPLKQIKTIKFQKHGNWC